MALFFSVFFLKRQRPPSSTLFPYTTLFRSGGTEDAEPNGTGTRTLRSTPQSTAGREYPRESRPPRRPREGPREGDRKSTRLDSSHITRTNAGICLEKKYPFLRAIAPPPGIA